MPKQTDKVFEFASLADYSFKQRMMIRIADLTFFLLIKILGSTIRFEVKGQDNLDAIEASGKLPIYTFWHDRIFLGTYFFRDRGIVVMTSQSFDGEYIARFIQRFGYRAIRGSSSRGGARALVGIIKSMIAGNPSAFTVDGPRGPRYEAKPGPILLAKKTGNPLLPFVVKPQKFWTLKSWDRMQIPQPFSKALVLIAEPIYVEPDADEAKLAEKLGFLQETLDNLVKEAVDWRSG